MSNNIIEGNPTKKFFIDMITRDISIEDAIIDLLDNSIDGANKINPDNYSGLYIDLIINNNEFTISDNCGGFSLETAQKYAFRFGRPDEAPIVKNTVGRFGIGMKRSLFKIGKNFVVESETDREHFRVKVNVDEWSQKKKDIIIDGYEKSIDDWDFTYELIDDASRGYGGTYIHVTDLNKEVKDLFTDDVFLSDLIESIQKLLNFSLLKGIKITLNGKPLKGQRTELLYSDDHKPYYAEGEINGVKYRIIAGLGEIGEPKLSGWYIYCNNRLVVEADTSNITGWGVASIPKWHINFVVFRGLLFLDSEETLKLPLTTTKKGIDATSDIYKKLLPIMRHAMTSVLDFLKQVPKMGDKANEYRQMLCDNSEKKSAIELKNMTFANHPVRKFDAPELDLEVISEKKDTVRIAFDANKNIANMAKMHSNARSFKELGEIMLEYYLRMEDIDYEES